MNQRDARDMWVLGEWDWWITYSGERLHAGEVEYDPADWETQGRGVTACGRRGWLFIPGIFSRMGCPRCKACCRKMGYPPGIGSPKNDPACRPLVEARIAGRAQ